MKQSRHSGSYSAIPAIFPDILNRPSPRKERIEQQLRREISQILLKDMNDPVLSYVSILSVAASKDMKNATVTVSIIGEGNVRHQAIRVLRRASGYIRVLLGRRLENLRTIPVLAFTIDRSVQYSIQMSTLLTEIAPKSDEVGHTTRDDNE